MDYQAEQQKWEAKKAARAYVAGQLLHAYPHLVPAGDSLTTAAKNIRIELKRAFPGVAFSVKTKRFSGGNDIRVCWIDGPNIRQVDAIIQRYKSGDFDGMTDSYDYRRDHAWTDAFGEAKYIFAEREYSDDMAASIARYVRNRLGGIDATETEIVQAWRKGNLYQIKQSGGCDVSREFIGALCKRTCTMSQGA